MVPRENNDKHYHIKIYRVHLDRGGSLIVIVIRND